MTKIAILYICTGMYKVFWKEFYQSSEKYFIPNSQKHYYVFTDAEQIEFENKFNNINRIYIENMPWPYATLLRYSLFTGIRDQLKEYDYIFFFNANTEIKQNISEEMFLPSGKEKLIAIRHPWYVTMPNYAYPYDRNPKTHAYIMYGRGKVYAQACIMGGEGPSFLDMCEKLKRVTDIDLKKNNIPLWHDESYFNRYIVNRRDIKVLSPSYAYPEGWEGYQMETKILMRDKKRYFDVDSFKRNDKCASTVPTYIKALDQISLYFVKKMRSLRYYLTHMFHS